MHLAQRTAGPRLAHTLAAVLCTLTVGCTARDASTVPDTFPWVFDEVKADVRAASCPPGTDRDAGRRVALEAEGFSLSHVNPARDLPGATFAGVWHLSSPDPAFGGLSGLALQPDGNLLAISDQGAFVWIELVDGVPVAARIAQMRDAAGDVLTGGRWRDAEGLDLRDGIAVVSFEREHRVLAFDLAGCGAAARGVEVARLGNRIAGMRDVLPANAGAEGLVLTAEGEMLLAIEAADSGLPVARLDAGGSAGVVGRLDPRGAPVLTGIDRSGDTLYAVLRSYVPMVGNTIEVVALPLPGRDSVLPAERILRLEPRQGTDNVEGIAVAARKDGSLRLWLVSDDNVSDRQRTLLYAFDRCPPATSGRCDRRSARHPGS